MGDGDTLPRKGKRGWGRGRGGGGPHAEGAVLLNTDRAVDAGSFLVHPHPYRVVHQRLPVARPAQATEGLGPILQP